MVKEKKEDLMFYIVTRIGSIFLANGERRNDGTPSLQKVKEGEGSVIKKGGYLHGGKLVGITEKGLLLYNDDDFINRKKDRPDRPDEEIQDNTQKISPIVGLFTETLLLMQCSSTKVITTWDPLWFRHSLETLRLIGDENDMFILSTTLSKLVKKRFSHMVFLKEYGNQ